MLDNKIELTSERLPDKIYTIRNKQVMLDYDLAEIYGYTTSAFNQQVQRNIEKFEGEEFMFRLTEDETKNFLLSHFVIAKNDGRGGDRRSPYAFTEQGIYMLMTVLKGELATKQSRALVMTFKAMKDYLMCDGALNQSNINSLVIKDHLRIDLLENYFNKQREREKMNKIFFEGQIYDAYSLLLDILNTASKEIIVIDNYIDKKMLDVIKETNKKVLIISSSIDQNLKEKYQDQYKNVDFIKNNTIHDRFIIIDRTNLYSCGASFKDLGKKCFAINLMENPAELNELLGKISTCQNQKCPL